jgi:diguanylate cyclase (GGDEF)-like protein
VATPAAPDQPQTLFDYAPISLWEEDYSGIRRLFDDLRSQGVRALDAHLDQHPEFGEACIRQMSVLRVNRQTLAMLKAASQEQLVASLEQVFHDGMRHHFRSELLALWGGELEWSGEGINYALDGEPVDILLHWRILPGSERTWEHVLVTIEDITARKRAERRLQSLFEASPVSLWEEDYRAVREYFDALRGNGVRDLEAYLHENPQAVTECMSLIKVLDVNQKTLDLFGAKSKEELLSNLERVFRGEMTAHFARELVDLWNGKTAYERDGINYSLDGEPLNIHLDFRVMPGHEVNFGWVLVAVQDITARKKAEEYLRYLGTHDVMTGLYNRAYFMETLQRLEKEHREPVSIVVADLNGLKGINDSLGHHAGDDMIRRTAEVLKAAFVEDSIAARVGGDEFVVLMPGAAAQTADEALEHLNALVEMNNKYYREPELTIAFGVATSRPGLPLEKVVSLADEAMYRKKGQYYRRRRDDQK